MYSKLSCKYANHLYKNCQTGSNLFTRSLKGYDKENQKTFKIFRIYHKVNILI